MYIIRQQASWKYIFYSWGGGGGGNDQFLYVNCHVVNLESQFSESKIIMQGVLSDSSRR